MTAAGTAAVRPAVATPAPLDSTDPRQPGLGAAGLLLVVPVAWLLGFALGPDTSLRVLGPLVTFALPATVMVAFWWENWPGTRLWASWSGWADTVLIAVLAVALTALGQAIVGTFDLRTLFDPTPATGQTPTFPDTMPLAGAVFVAMLQLTFACEGWPLLGRLPPVLAGVVALATAWLVGLVLWTAIPELRAMPVLLGAWQVLIYVAWRGWPFSAIERRALRLPLANVAVIAGAGLTFALADAAGAPDAGITAVAGSFVAATLLVGMLFEGWLGRAATLAAILVVGAALELALQAYNADDDWVTHASLNAISVAVLLHVAIGRRWPLAGPASG